MWHRQGSTMSQSQLTLPTNRAFVVQFHAQTPEALSAYEGRIEHVVSGQVARFHSLEELLAFMIRVLTDVQQQSDSP
jgi:phage baseplate assembly protein W